MCCHPAITLSCLCVRNEATTGGQFTKLDRPTGLLFQRALRYQFETRCVYLVGGTTHRVWVPSQFGQLKLLYNQKYTKYIFCIYVLITLDKSLKFIANHSCLVHFGVFDVFRTFWHILIYQFEAWYLHRAGGTTHRVRDSSQSGYFDLRNSQKYVRLFFLHLWS